MRIRFFVLIVGIVVGICKTARMLNDPGFIPCKYTRGVCNMISPFCKTYLQSQGVYVYAEIKRVTKPVPKREEVFVLVVPEYERGD